MFQRPLVRLALVGVLAGAGACEAPIDLSTGLAATDVFTGWYDNGVIQEGQFQGWNHLVPSVSFRLKNTATVPLANVQLIVSFWAAGADGPAADREIVGLGSTELAPGASTDALTVRSTIGHNLQAARADFFTHSLYKDFTAKLFARRSGRIYRLGEFPIDQRIIPHVSPPRP